MLYYFNFKYEGFDGKEKEFTVNTFATDFRLNYQRPYNDRNRQVILVLSSPETYDTATTPIFGGRYKLSSVKQHYDDKVNPFKLLVLCPGLTKGTWEGLCRKTRLSQSFLSHWLTNIEINPDRKKILKIQRAARRKIRAILFAINIYSHYQIYATFYRRFVRQPRITVFQVPVPSSLSNDD